MALAKQDKSGPASSTLKEIESIFDRSASWVSANPAMFLSIVTALLVVGAVAGVGDWYFKEREKDAAGAVGRTQVAYFTALGAGPEEFEEVEPANPDMKHDVMKEYLMLFLDLAEEHSGSDAAVQALVEAGAIQTEQDDLEGAIKSYRKAAARAQGNDSLAGLANLRLGQSLERLSRWSEAGETYERTANLSAFPLRNYALLAAGRSYLRAGDAEKANALATRFERAAETAELPAHLETMAAAIRNEASALKASPRDN